MPCESDPESGEKLSPVLTLYRAADFDVAAATVERIYAYEGAGHSVGLHSTIAERAMTLGLTLPVARVIVLPEIKTLPVKSVFVDW